MAQAAAIWGEHPWEIALITDSYDVADLPAQYGALLNQLLKATCPTAMAPLHRRWWFFVAPDSIPAAQIEAAGGTLHAGPADWLPAPGTSTDTTGRIRWLVHPHLTHWHPYHRRDAIDQVLPPHPEPDFSLPAQAALDSPATRPALPADRLGR